MSNITLIATTHKEKGMCNSTELLKILQSIKPDIIFEELSQYYFNAIYDGQLPDTLETDAIKKYLKEDIVNHIPVDIDVNQLIDKNLKNSITKMFDIFDKNPEYQNLQLQLHNLSFNLGFPYLNSIQCEALFAQKFFLEQKLAESYKQEGLVKLHQTWIQILDYRERQMLANIYRYKELQDFGNAIFLVGAEHRKPIIDLLDQKKVDGTAGIKWNLEYFVN